MRPVTFFERFLTLAPVVSAAAATSPGRRRAEKTKESRGRLAGGGRRAYLPYGALISRGSGATASTRARGGAHAYVRYDPILSFSSPFSFCLDFFEICLFDLAAINIGSPYPAAFFSFLSLPHLERKR